MGSREKPGLAADTAGTAERASRISSALMRAVAVEIPSAVPAKHSLSFTPAVRCWKKILHLKTGPFPLLSETAAAFPLPSVSQSSVISG